MMKKALVALAFSAVAVSAQAGALLEEGFDSVATLTTKGWVMKNASTDIGSTPGWFQAFEQAFPALTGAANSYAAANYNNTIPGGMIDSWLITPEFSTAQGAIVSFWLQSEAFEGTSDQVAFGFSNGSSALTSFALGSPVAVAANGWNRYEAVIGKSAGTARFAFQYTGAFETSNYVGLDNLLVSEVPEPTTMMILAAGVMGLTMSRRRKRG
jgi:hypothetical protein